MPLNIEELAKKLGKASRCGAGWICCCPAHDDHNPSLSLSWDHTQQKLLVYCHAGCAFESIMAAIKRRGHDLSNLAQQPQRFITLPTFKNEYARRIWQRTESANDSVVETYLRSRGYTGSIPPAIRYHPRLYHALSKTYYPAMVARVEWWPHTNSCSIHRTYLSKDGTGKAPVKDGENKMMLGAVKGGAVRLTPPGQALIIAEGIETALSVYESTQLPTWAALSTQFMGHIVVPSPKTTQEIIIAADGDQPGLDAAKKLAKRLANQGYAVRIAPAPEGLDFNDVLRRSE